MTTTAFDAWHQRAATTPIATAAEQLGLTLRRVTGGRGGPIEMAGPCPRCGGDDRFAVNARKSVFNCRQCGGKGHGAIDLAIFARDVSFLQACELLTGEPPPDRGAQLTDADRQRWQREAAELAERRAHEEEEENSFREAERRKLFGYWRRALDLPGTPAEAYIALRGLRAPAGLRARCILDMPYYAGGADKGDVLAHAPVLVLPIVDVAGVFRGLHMTYLDLAQPKGKLKIADPKKPDEFLDAKKVRGSKKGNHVVIAAPPADVATTALIVGEGFEKTLAVWMALEASGRDLGTTTFWSACDLGNLTGKSAGRGRAQLADPDPEDPGLVIPDSVTDLVLLGDSTSEGFTTRCAMHRAAVRYSRPGRSVRVAWAPEGRDFDDMLREAA